MAIAILKDDLTCLLFLATQVNARIMVHPMEVFLFVGAVYWVLCTLLDLASRFAARATRNSVLQPEATPASTH
ncbi:hypothetical protein [Ottowia thiooxydans]|uniref:hypothetical protein n=1 Tax=Ottowia thiooxydans TaxID=219182 RepID=UPI0003F86CBC|nr:hypothetical protein [Ottowia thiooxydans]